MAAGDHDGDETERAVFSCAGRDRLQDWNRDQRSNGRADAMHGIFLPLMHRVRR
jgi:hypothetical protein